MTHTVILFLFVSGLAFSVGFAIRRGSICAVAAADQWVLHRRATRMKAFVTAACWAGVVVLPSAWLLPEWVVLSPAYPATLLGAAGGVLFGFGAYVNRACAFGTLAHLSGGDTNYLATIAGVAFGAVVAPHLIPFTSDPASSVLTEPSFLAVGTFIAFALIAGRATWRHFRSRGHKLALGVGLRTRRQWRPATAMVVIGLAGGLLNAIVGEWSYMAVLSKQAAGLLDPGLRATSWPALAGAVALLAGGTVAAISSARFRLAAPKLRSLIQKFLGGVMMSLAATLIPGGNDVMLLYGVPSLAPHALVAYAAMTVTLLGFFYIQRSWGSWTK